MVNIFQVKDFNFIEEHINQANEDTLVIFDVDEVLITSSDEILKPYNNEFAERMEQDLESRFSQPLHRLLEETLIILKLPASMKKKKICSFPINEGL